MDIHTIIATYQQTIQQGREKLSKVKNKIYRIGSLKLLLFVACIAGIIYFVSAGWTTILGVIAITLTRFSYWSSTTTAYSTKKIIWRKR